MHEKPVFMSKTLRAIAIALILVPYFTLTYTSWWMAIVGSVLIVLLSRLVWPGRGVKVVGLRIPLEQIGVSLFLLCIVLIGSFEIITAITRCEGIIFVPLYENRKWVLYLVHTVGQTLNEEMVLGALFLRFIENKFRLIHPFVISVGVALIFSLLHYLFYGLRPSQSLHYGVLSLTTLISLFSMGVVRNNCILSTGNIGYAWAIHIGWNIVFADSSFYLSESSTKLTEPSMFNLILGNRHVVMITSVLMALSLLLYIKKRPPGEQGGKR
jgi:hypothetical protein